MNTSLDSRDEDFYLSDLARRGIRYWWIVILLMVLGGVTGSLISFLRHPVYESTGVITTVIDFAYAGRLSDYEEDHLVTAIGDIIQSDTVLNEVDKESIKQGLTSAPEEVLSHLAAFRQGYRWELSSRYDDPITAQAVNRIWMQAALHSLEQLRLDSITAIAELNNQAGIENCFQQAVILDPSSPFCSVEEINQLRSQIDQLDTSLSDRSLLTRLLASRISFQVVKEPDLPSKPAYLGRNLAALAGAGIGLLAALILFLSGTLRVENHGSSQ